jgi:ABC-type arginine transport system ATPase subunit
MIMQKKIIKDPELLMLMEECRVLKEKISANVIEISKNISKSNVIYPKPKKEVNVLKNESTRDVQN